MQSSALLIRAAGKVPTVFKAVTACRQPNHPICIIKEAIVDFLHQTYPGRFKSFDDLYPIVSAKAVSMPNVTLAEAHVPYVQSWQQKVTLCRLHAEL